jgi:hypothetical protein
MTIEDVIKAIVSAIIGFVVPSALKQFFPVIRPRDTMPWLEWCIAGFIGGALGGFASGAIGLMGVGAGGFGNWAVFGVSIGLLQWFALRGYREVGTWFVVASMLGWMLFIFGGAFGWIVSGTAVGLLQYLSLTNYKGAAWWILGNAIVWTVAGAVGIIAGTPLLSMNPVMAWVFGWGVVGFVGAILLLIPLAQLRTR